jgi:hypothetical protein
VNLSLPITFWIRLIPSWKNVDKQDSRGWSCCWIVLDIWNVKWTCDLKYLDRCSWLVIYDWWSRMNEEFKVSHSPRFHCNLEFLQPIIRLEKWMVSPGSRRISLFTLWCLG